MSGLQSFGSTETVFNAIIASLDPPKGNALLLTTNTEVSIAPKLHRKKDIPSSKPLVNGNSAVSTKPAVNGGPKKESSVPNVASETLRVLPARLAQAVNHPEHNGSELLVLVSPKILSKLLPPKFDHTSNTFYQGAFTQLTPPSDPSSSTTPAPPVEPSVKVLNAGGREDSGEKVQKTSQDGGIFVGASESVPYGHIVFSALPDGLNEWDLLKYVFTMWSNLY